MSVFHILRAARGGFTYRGRASRPGTLMEGSMYRLASTPHLVQAPTLLLLLAVAGCNDGSSYRSPSAPEPPGPAVPAPEPPAPPAVDLSGNWSGTMTVTWDELDGGGTCVEAVTARFTQAGAAVTGAITETAACSLETGYRFEGTLEGTFLHGAVSGADWSMFGLLDEEGLHLWAFNMGWNLLRSTDEG
jgi:hypothetical protein